MRSLALVLLLIATQAFAHTGGHDHDDHCERHLDSQPGPIEFHSSGRDEKLEGQLREDAAIVTKVAHEMGLATPPHKYYFVPDEQLNVMAALGGQPLPHWLHGLQITQSMGRVMGVLEFVTPGCPTCRSYYSDKTHHIHQRSVLMHVAGHNDVAETAIRVKKRQVDPPGDGLKLAHKISEAYEKYDHDEVSAFVQKLSSLDYLMDFTNGTVELPEKFAIKPSDRNRMTDAPSWAKTPNPLAALVHQLDPSAPEWQREILVLYEKVKRVYPAYANTKVFNEGWATLQQWLLAKHIPGWNTTKDVIEYATLMGGVAYPSLDNPYWVGVKGWDNLYKQFMERPEIAKIPSEKERDKAFIAYARALYAPLSDYDWLQIAIDQEFCDRWKLFLYRKTLESELDPGIPPEKQKFIALSRDAVRIRQHLIRKLSDWSLKVPLIELNNPAVKDPSELHFSQVLLHKLPLEPVSAFKTMFVIANTFSKRVKLTAYISPFKVVDPRALVAAAWIKQFPHYPPDQLHEMAKNLSIAQAWSQAMQMGLIDLPSDPVKVIFEVSPGGDVKASLPNATGENPQLTGLIALGKQAIADYQEDHVTSFDRDLTEAQKKRWDALMTRTSDHVSNSSMEIVQYAPYAGRALEELLQLIDIRMPKIFRKAVASGKVTPGKNGVRLKVLPEVPSFNYDYQFKNFLTQNRPPAPVDGKTTPPERDWGIDDNGSVIGASEYLPGDKFAPRQKPNKGKGKGEEGDPSDEEGDEQGESEDNDGDEPQPGDGEGDDSDMEIPLSLYGELLAQELELPNLRRTGGESEKNRRLRHGKVHKPNGNQLWHEIAIEAMHIANGVRKSKGEPYGNKVSPYTLIREGMRYIDPSNYVVSGKTVKPKPDFDAVLVVNIDLTGSMMGERIEMAKNLVFNLKALLAAQYKRVIVHYVGFDSTADEYPEEKIWTAWKGGGTAYAPAIQKDKEILAKYQTSKFNKFILTIGDGETADGAQFVEELESLSKDLQYAGLAITTNGTWGGYQDLLNQVEGLKGRWEWVGTTIMTSKNQIMQALKELFPKGEKKK